MKTQRLINSLKFNAYKLRLGGQIPSTLFDYICLLHEDSSVEDIKFYETLCIHYLRIKGYYNQFKDIEKKCNDEIVNAVESRKEK